MEILKQSFERNKRGLLKIAGIAGLSTALYAAGIEGVYAQPQIIMINPAPFHAELTFIFGNRDNLFGAVGGMVAGVYIGLASTENYAGVKFDPVIITKSALAGCIGGTAFVVCIPVLARLLPF